LVRVLSVDLAVDLFRSASPRASCIDEAMREIAKHPAGGVLVFLRDSTMSWSSRYRDGLPTASPALSVREHGVGAQVLRNLGVREMIVMTSQPKQMRALEGYGLKIVGPPLSDE